MNPLSHPGTLQIPENDIEKRGELKSTEVDVTAKAGSDTDVANSPTLDSSTEHDIAPTPVLLKGKLGEWNSKVENLAGLEARGITRVLPEEKHERGAYGYLQMFLLWFSIDLVATNIITGMLGPLIFALGWKDSICISIFALALSCCGPSYTATWGPVSGNRTMVIGRYFMGYWPAKVAGAFNVIMQIGWGTIGCIVAGQMFSAVNGAGMTIAVGCIVAALLIGLIATFGIALVHSYERYAFIPQAIVILVLLGSVGKHIDTSAQSIGTAAEITANRCSFFALEFGSVIGFSAVAADFYVYYPTKTSKPLTFFSTWAGNWTALIFCNIIGIGIATAVPNIPEWNDAYMVSSGALLLKTYEGLGGFGGFCVVILALGSVTNNAPCSYAAALTLQILGRYAKAIPRWMWCIAITIVELVCSVAGRNHLYPIFQNFLPITSYWVVPWLTVVAEEHLIFRKLRGVPFDWTAWEDKKRLPLGAAAFFAWASGWAGAVIGMSQVWYHGPVALKVGGYGGDIGAWLAIGFTGILFPPLRYLELKLVGR